MNGEGGIGRAEEDLAYLRGDFVTGIDFGSSSIGGFYPNISMGFIPALPQTFFELPVLLPGSPASSDAVGDSATPRVEAVPSVVVDPEQGTQTTVFEGADAPYVAERTRETDWDWVYDQYVILNTPAAPEVDVPFHNGIDWGSIAGAVVGGFFDPFGAGAAVQTAFAPGVTVPSATAAIPGPPAALGITGGTTMAGCPPVGPKYAKICLATREITPLRRRRRRRLLTSSDIKDLAALKAIVGGAALQGAVVQAIRR